MAGLFLRIPIGDSGNLGPGKARLLELIEETGSIRAAASKMKVSYRRAWLSAAGHRAHFRRQGVWNGTRAGKRAAARH